MIYKYSQIVFGIILLYNVTKQHYIPPPDFCTFAKTCNHTGVSVCGVEKILNTRLFLDECDLFEYNCDKHKEYAEMNMEKCPSNETGLNSTVTLSSITTTATLNISVPVETAASANTSVILNITAASANTSAILNITAASANTSVILNITAASANISAILNITAASANTSEILNITAASANTSEILNITAASANTSAILNTTATSANKSDILNTTLTKSSTKSSSVPAEITTIITRNNSSSAKLNLNITCVCPTVTCPVLNNTTMISQNVTTASIDTIPVIVLSTEKTNNVISKKVTTNLQNTISIINETVTSPIVSTTTNSTKTALTICTHRIITSNTSSLIEKNTTTASTVPKSSPNKEDGQTTTGKKKQNGTNTSQDKCAYPKHCNRPSTWETTVKGETRDFYQILRAQFGDRVKILRDTTHFPRRIAKEINDDNEAFHFGYHNERMNEVL